MLPEAAVHFHGPAHRLLTTQLQQFKTKRTATFSACMAADSGSASENSAACLLAMELGIPTSTWPCAEVEYANATATADGVAAYALAAEIFLARFTGLLE